MAHDSLPAEVFYAVEKLRDHLRRNGFKNFREEEALPFREHLGWRPNFYARQEGVIHSFDLRSDFKLDPAPFSNFIHQCKGLRLDIAIWLVVASKDENEPSGSISLRKQAKLIGIGVCYVTPSTDIHILEYPTPLSIHQNFSEDQIKAGSLTQRTRTAKDLFENGQWIAAATELTQAFEEAIVKLGHRATTKGITKKAKADFDRITNLHDKIDFLGRDTEYITPPSIFGKDLTRDCIAYKGSRNLTNHARPTIKQKRQLFEQALEIMITGFRLIKEIERIRTSIR
ncbi:hypothetical protein [uncultured Deinococcus sp.]|uniref:hypothetical protein n=1 Tax=uncultured Deinococcus sp. TaxID=158789 RepID=UPI00258DE1A7|nr:hypothetical protein [uncultured Deinococcus sp.]